MANLLLTVTGMDRPGVTAGLLNALAPLGVQLLDVEQVVVRNRLLLGILVAPGPDPRATIAAGQQWAGDLGVDVAAEWVADTGDHSSGRMRHHVTILGHPLTASTVSALAAAVVESGATIERIVRLSRYPVMSLELLVAATDPLRLRGDLALTAARHEVDVAVERAGLHRRAKRLVVLDVDSTLVQGEVIELLAVEAGCRPQVAGITARAMAGEQDFESSLRERVALLAGLELAAVDRVRAQLRFTPGARTLVRTLQRLGYVSGIVSGGFSHITDPLAAELGLDFAAANTLGVYDGRLTGDLVGPVVDRAGKAAALQRFAARAGVPMAQTVAVGDGANDLDMLAVAGLGIAFNAKPVVRAAADYAVTVPYLDAILFLLGVSREEVEAADAELGG